MTAITFWSRRVVKLQSPLCEFGNGPVLNPVTGARTDYDIAKGSAPDPPSLCVDIWDDTGNNIVEHVAGGVPFLVRLKMNGCSLFGCSARSNRLCENSCPDFSLLLLLGADEQILVRGPAASKK